LNRKTGEVLRVMDRGTQAIASLLSYIWFSIVPVLVDIAIAVIYFILQFDLYLGLVVMATMILYLVVTIGTLFSHKQPLMGSGDGMANSI
jgi:ABC-type transport system involved in Fe-S cluster assembly fused permease/ATPase subunit